MILHQLSIILRPRSLLSKNFRQMNFKNDQEVRTIGTNDQVGPTMQQGLFFNALVYCLKGQRLYHRVYPKDIILNGLKAPNKTIFIANF